MFFLIAENTRAEDADWQDISSKFSISKSEPVKNKGGSNVTINVQITNTSGTDINDPFRLVLIDLDSPFQKVITDLELNTGLAKLANISGLTDAGEPYYDLTPFIDSLFIQGTSSDPIGINIEGGGAKLVTFDFRVEKELLKVNITQPETLITVGSTPLTIQGTINDPTATLTVNGIPVTQSNENFTAQVALSEGHNTVLARAVAIDGSEVTDSISLALDTTPPYITIDSPIDGTIIKQNTIAVSGLINDIVRGTINAAQANVVVNNKTATVSNRSYLAEGIVLTEGDNSITVSASDEQGNTASKTIIVKYQVPDAKRIEIVSGQNQNGKILSVLTAPLKAKLINSNGEPVANTNVIYRVIQGDGIAGIGTADEGQGVLTKTNADGIASTTFKLGSRSGKGNHKVRAKAVGFDSEVVFYASAETNPGNKVSINAGNNQRGAPKQSLPQPLIVAVTDQGANLVQGTQIEFKVTTGGGQFQNREATYTSTTDSDGRATASFTLGQEIGLDVHRVTATIIGTELTAGFTASALQPGDPGQTSITGIVLDNQDTPLPRVTVRIKGSNRQAETDTQGQFKITEAPVGPIHLIVDGSTTTATGEWPTLSYNIVTIAGAENPLAAPVYMVKLDTENAVYVGKEDQEITLKEVPGFKLQVKAGSITFPDGAKEGYLSVTPVNASKIPMAPPNGMQPQFIVTIQPAGAIFDPPAPLTLPNVDGHKPGAEVEMYSFDHDLEEFVSIGLGTVSTDGSVIKTNTGIGVIKAGWHCGSQPGGQGCANNCAICKDCDGDCNCVATDNDPRLEELPCKACNNGIAKNILEGLLILSQVDPIPEDCKASICQQGQAVYGTWDLDKPDPVTDADNYCKTCSDGEIVNDDKPSTDCKFCREGVLVDVSGSTEPFGVNVLNYPPIGTIVPSAKDYGVTRFDTPIIDITAYCAGSTWKVKLTKADLQIYQGSHMNGDIDVTSTLIKNETDCTVLDLMKESIDSASQITSDGGFGPSFGYYMLSAIDAHEDVHVEQYKEGIVSFFADFKASVDGLSIPLKEAENETDAKAQIIGSHDYLFPESIFIAESANVHIASGEHNPIEPFVEAEREVVIVKISEINVRKVELGCP